MTGQIDVYLITGFLGSGKTTFLNRLIGQFPGDRRLMILMNEFGEIGVDGTLISGEDLEILEISKGSIFCACVKTDFIRGLFEIANKIRPDVLLIESTGVANPTDLKKDLELSVFNGRFLLREQFCMVDADSFLDAFGVFASVENQIASSTLFIINKVDQATRERIEEIKRVIRTYHPDPRFLETIYASVDVAGLIAPERAVFSDDSLPAGGGITEEELDQYIEDLLSQTNASLSPPDILMSATFQWKGGPVEYIEAMARSLPREVVRGKGFLTEGKHTYFFSLVMGRFSIEGWDSPVAEGRENILVFIAPPGAMPSLEAVALGHNFVKTGELAPGMP